MRPFNIFIVRHGESEGNVDKTAYERVPDYAIPLTPLGWVQAREAGEQIQEQVKGSRIFTYYSPFRRAKETFMGIASALNADQLYANQLYEGGDKLFREDVRLREQERWGNFRPPKFMEEIDPQRDAFGTFFYRFLSGESCADVYDRMSGFLDTLYRDFERTNYPSHCVIVCHGTLLRVLLMRWFHWTVEEFEMLANPPNGSIVKLELDPSWTYSGRNSAKYRLVGSLRKYEQPTHPYHFPLTLPLSPPTPL